MGKNKLQKFDDMSGYPHVFQYPFAVLREKGFDMKVGGISIFLRTTIPLSSNWAAVKVSTP